MLALHPSRLIESFQIVESAYCVGFYDQDNVFFKLSDRHWLPEDFDYSYAVGRRSYVVRCSFGNTVADRPITADGAYALVRRWRREQRERQAARAQENL